MEDNKTIESVLAWRKKELLHFRAKFYGFDELSDKDKLYYYKSSILLIYSHLEGGIIDCLKEYLASISNLKAKNSSIRIGTIFLANIDKVKKFDLNSELIINDDIFKFETSDKNLKFGSNYNDNIIVNLKSLLEIDEPSINRPYLEGFKTKFLETRNRIAHGYKLIDETTINKEYLEKYYEMVMKILDTFSVQLSNNIENKAYLTDGAKKF
ncbi:MAG: MAE_28990/MAE_18760 family HEPN-like nuclease [Defluviitaleaceae bacterium]|nr:MAE_28990/MAE_18760 family HEPN-like nuclease [Defluviitaleaceae bacterium]